MRRDIRGRAGGVRRKMRAALRAADEMSNAPRELLFLLFQFFNVSHQFRFTGKAAEVETDHFKRALRRLAARPQCNQHAGDDRAVGLNLDAVLFVAQQVFASQHLLEKSEKDFNRPSISKH